MFIKNYKTNYVFMVFFHIYLYVYQLKDVNIIKMQSIYINNTYLIWFNLLIHKYRIH